MAASPNATTNGETFEDELKNIQHALNSRWSSAVGDTFLDAVEEEEFDRDEIIEDITDGLAGDEGDSNLLAELDLIDSKERRRCGLLILQMLNVHIETSSGEGEGEEEEPVQTPSKKRYTCLDDLNVVEMEDEEFSRLTVSHLQRLRVPEVDQALLVSMLQRRGYSGLRFSCLLTERRSELNFCKMLKTCNVPMGKAKEVFKMLKMRVQMERQYRLPTYGKTKGVPTTTLAASFMSSDSVAAAADPFVAFQEYVAAPDPFTRNVPLSWS